MEELKNKVIEAIQSYLDDKYMTEDGRAVYDIDNLVYELKDLMRAGVVGKQLAIEFAIATEDREMAAMVAQELEN